MLRRNIISTQPVHKLHNAVFLAGLQSIWSYVTNTSSLWLKFPKYDITEPETDLTPRWAISLVDIRRGVFERDVLGIEK